MPCSSSPLSCSIWHLDGISCMCALLTTSNGLEVPLLWSDGLDPAIYERLVLLRQSEAPPPRHGGPQLCKFTKIQLDLRPVPLC